MQKRKIKIKYSLTYNTANMKVAQKSVVNQPKLSSEFSQNKTPPSFDSGVLKSILDN